jgi:hypothetical protein
MRARPIFEIKTSFNDGAILEIRIWQLPSVTEERPHGLKYSLFYGRPGERIVGYDNELGKGDHIHYRERQVPYKFNDLRTLLFDFRADVRKERTQK